jgi:hypothetical protein
MQALWENQKHTITPSVKIRTRPAAPYRSIEDPKQTPAMDVFIALTNEGNAPTLLTPDGITVIVYLAHPGVESVSSGGFMAPTILFAGQTSSLTRADTLKFTAPSLAPRQTRTIGPIQLPVITKSEAISPLIVTWEVRGEAETITGKMEYSTPKP